MAAQLAQQLSGHSQVRIEDGELIVSPLTAEERPAGCVVLEEKIVERLPHIDLPALLIEVDGWVNFTTALTHAGGSEPRKADLLPTLYASLLAQSGNFGLTQMARMSGFSYQQLLWTTHWYLREETLRESTAELVNYHHRLPLVSPMVYVPGKFVQAQGVFFSSTDLNISGSNQTLQINPRKK